MGVCASWSKGELRPHPSLCLPLPSLLPASHQDPITSPLIPTPPNPFISPTSDFTLFCLSQYFSPKHEEPLPAHPPSLAPPRLPPVGLGRVQESPFPLPLLGEIQQAAAFCF